MAVEAFNFLLAQPSHGQRQTLISWRVRRGLENSDFYVFRSVDGRQKWELLNDGNPAHGDSFLDETFVIHNMDVLPYYRVLAEHATGDYDSPEIGLYDQMTREEYGIVAETMLQQYLQARHDGLPMFHCTPLLKGIPCPQIDAATRQVIGDCAPADPEDDCYGQTFKGGFAPPLQTYVRFLDGAALSTKDNSEGMGSQQSYVRRVRLLAFPRPRTGDMFVHPSTDNRYVVDEEVVPILFKGLVPLYFETNLVRLTREDARYRLSMPMWEAMA